MIDRNYENLYWEAQGHINELEGENAALKREKERMMKLAHDYITAYEKLAFGDALLADTQEGMSLSEVKEKYLPNRDLNELRGVEDTQEKTS